jgi:predicted Ser/Thr protein kinase
MQLNKSGIPPLEEHVDKKFEVLRTWQTPGPGFDPHGLRQKQFKLVRFECGCLAVCKMDSAPEYVAHEAAVLSGLDKLDYVPSLVCQTPTAIYTKYIEGKLLPEVISSLGIGECMKIGWQILVIVAGIHNKGVVHSDIRPWNFILGEDAHLYLIDFEYAYNRSLTDVTELLSVHHGVRLKTVTTDWSDALRSIGNTWQASGHWLVKFALAYLPLGIHWASRPVILAQQIGNWRRGMFS